MLRTHHFQIWGHIKIWRASIILNHHVQQRARFEIVVVLHIFFKCFSLEVSQAAFRHRGTRHVVLIWHRNTHHNQNCVPKHQGTTFFQLHIFKGGVFYNPSKHPVQLGNSKVRNVVDYPARAERSKLYLGKWFSLNFRQRADKRDTKLKKCKKLLRAQQAYSCTPTAEF